MNGLFPIDAWKQIFGRIPPYPTSLPDDLVRQIADLAIHVRNLSEQIETGVNGDDMQAWMGLSLVLGSMKRISVHVETLLRQKAQEQQERAPDLTPGTRSP